MGIEDGGNVVSLEEKVGAQTSRTVTAALAEFGSFADALLKGYENLLKGMNRDMLETVVGEVNQTYKEYVYIISHNESEGIFNLILSFWESYTALQFRKFQEIPFELEILVDNLRKSLESHIHCRRLTIGMNNITGAGDEILIPFATIIRTN